MQRVDERRVGQHRPRGPDDVVAEIQRVLEVDHLRAGGSRNGAPVLGVETLSAHGPEQAGELGAVGVDEVLAWGRRTSENRLSWLGHRLGERRSVLGHEHAAAASRSSAAAR